MPLTGLKYVDKIVANIHLTQKFKFQQVVVYAGNEANYTIWVYMH